MSKLIILVFSLSFLPFTSTFAGEECPEGIQHYVLIHGIGAKGGTFGSMNKVLEKYLSCSQAHTFEYQTRDSDLTVTDFAINLSHFIDQIPQSKEKDLSFIMHSQGGLIGLTLLQKSFEGDPRFKNSNLARVKEFISMSSPFWGSDFALIGQKFFFNFDIEANFISPFGRKQLIDMKYGSEANLEIIANVFSEKGEEFRSYLSDNIEILNVSAIAPHQSRLLRNAHSQFFEGDFIVNLASMNLNPIYSIANDKTQDLEKASFIDITLGEVAYVEGTHIDFSLTPSLIFRHGVAKIPFYCRFISWCDHEGMNTLFTYLTEREVVSNDKVVDVIKGFELQVQVTLPKGLNLRDARVMVSEENPLIKLSNYRLNGENQEPVNVNEENSTSHFIVKGSSWSEGKTDLKLQIEHPEIKTKNIEVKIEKGRTTFLEVTTYSEKDE